MFEFMLTWCNAIFIGESVGFESVLYTKKNKFEFVWRAFLKKEGVLNSPDELQFWKIAKL